MMDAAKTRKFWFTFGSGQPHWGGYHVVEVPDAEDAEARARELMNQRFERWSMMYPSAEAAGVKEYGLFEVK